MVGRRDLAASVIEQSQRLFVIDLGTLEYA